MILYVAMRKVTGNEAILLHKRLSASKTCKEKSSKQDGADSVPVTVYMIDDLTDKFLSYFHNYHV